MPTGRHFFCYFLLINLVDIVFEMKLQWGREILFINSKYNQRLNLFGKVRSLKPIKSLKEIESMKDIKDIQEVTRKLPIELSNYSDVLSNSILKRLNQCIIAMMYTR